MDRWLSHASRTITLGPPPVKLRLLRKAQAFRLIGARKMQFKCNSNNSKKNRFSRVPN